MGSRDRSCSLFVFQVSRFCLLVINAVMFVFGLILFCFALWALSEGRGFFSNGLYMTCATTGLILSVIVLFVSALGFIGAKRRVRAFIIVFICFLTLVLILIICVAATAWLFKDKMNDALRNELYYSTASYFDSAFVQE